MGASIDDGPVDLTDDPSDYDVREIDLLTGGGDFAVEEHRPLRGGRRERQVAGPPELINEVGHAGGTMEPRTAPIEEMRPMGFRYSRSGC